MVKSSKNTNSSSVNTNTPSICDDPIIQFRTLSVRVDGVSSRIDNLSDKLDIVSEKIPDPKKLTIAEVIQLCAIIIGVIIAISTAIYSNFSINRQLDMISKRQDETSSKIEKLNDRLVKVDETTHILVGASKNKDK